jgi:hypothetical protein
MYFHETPPTSAPPIPAGPRPTVFHPGVNHAHAPTGRWTDVQKSSGKQCSILRSRALRSPTKLPGIAEAIAVECACANLSPSNVARVVRNTIMRLLPLGRKHFDHYVGGSGADLRVNLADILRRDRKFRAKLARNIRAHNVGHFKVNQSDYGVKDFQFAIGAIDRLDFEVDRRAGVVHVWFKDRYEWHPVGFGYKLLPGDGRRPSNCVHAAMVELKRSGAKDYWMIGDTTIPLSAVLGRGPVTSAPTRSPRTPTLPVL